MSETSATTDPESHGEAHATDRQYVGVATVLAVLTALEVMVFYIPALEPVLVPLLLVMMVAKFSLVVLFFMHLRFDDAIFSGLFSGPLLISVSVVLAMLALFGRLVAG